MAIWNPQFEQNLSAKRYFIWNFSNAQYPTPLGACRPQFGDKSCQLLGCKHLCQSDEFEPSLHLSVHWFFRDYFCTILLLVLSNPKGKSPEGWGQENGGPTRVPSSDWWPCHRKSDTATPKFPWQCGVGRRIYWFSLTRSFRLPRAFQNFMSTCK